MNLATGVQLGDYEILREIGRGGMGSVYLARDKALDRQVAIKTIVTSGANQEELILRFQREARAAARLIHPNIVQIHKVDIDHDPPYMAMEYVEGQSIEQLVLDRGAMSWQRALNVVSQVASALAAAHANGIVHRDIKLSNMLVDKNSRVKVTDFGIAKLMDSDLKLTRESRAIGSPCYMSPEHCGIGKVGPASDIFSLGVAAFEMMTGRLPFEADSAFEMMRKITSERIPPIRGINPEVPPVVESLVEHMAERRIELRYPSAAELLVDIKALRAKQTLPHLQAFLEREGTAGGPPQSGVAARAGGVTTSKRLTAPAQSPAALPGVMEIGVDEAGPLRESHHLGPAAATPFRRLFVAGIGFGLIALVAAGGALIALRLNDPGPGGAPGAGPVPQGGFTGTSAAVAEPRPLRDDEVPPELRAKLRRGDAGYFLLHNGRVVPATSRPGTDEVAPAQYVDDRWLPVRPDDIDELYPADPEFSLEE